jgi:phytanoyl-CoA hydroxylase
MMTKLDSQTDVLSKEEVDHFWTQGYLRVPDVYAPDEVDELADDLDLLIDRWARSEAWTGPWREALLGADLGAKIELRGLHDLRYYSAAWARATSNAKLANVLQCLLGDAVELHHTTMHVKPPERGQPFPLHQDWPFYPHADDRYVDVLLHLDDTSHDNGEICFLPGSHLGGPLQHVTVAGGTLCHPHLPTDKYRLEDAVPVPARRGDIVCFNINTVHGSYLNTTSKARRLVRLGYRHPDNVQIGGQAMSRPGVMVVGTKPRRDGQETYSPEI